MTRNFYLDQLPLVSLLVPHPYPLPAVGGLLSSKLYFYRFEPWNQKWNKVTIYGLTWRILVNIFIYYFNIAHILVKILSSVLIQLYEGSPDGLFYDIKYSFPRLQSMASSLMEQKLWWTYLHSKKKNITDSNQSHTQEYHFCPENIRSKFAFIFFKVEISTRNTGLRNFYDQTKFDQILTKDFVHPVSKS